MAARVERQRSRGMRRTERNFAKLYLGQLSIMYKHKNLRLFYRLLLVFLPFLIFSIVLASVVLTWTNYRFFLKNINQDYRSIIKSSAGEIRLFMDNAVRSLEGLSLVLTAAKLDPWRQQMALTAFSHSASEFMSIALVTVDGREIASTGQPGERIVYTENDTFKHPLSGRSSISEVRLTRENIPYVHIAAPLFNLGQVTGVMWADLNLKSVWDVLEGINIGNTGTVYIMDLSGRLIGNRDINSVMNSLQVAGPQIMEQLAKAGDTPVEWHDERADGTYYSLGFTIPNLGWVVVLSQLDQEIYAYLYDNIRWAGIITLLICITAIILGWNRMKSFLNPIHNLHSQVKKIGEGDLEQRVQIESEDEIGELGMAFNEMVDSLKKYINNEVETAIELAHVRSLAVVGTTYSKVTHEIGNYLNVVLMVCAGMKSEQLNPRAQRYMWMLEKDTQRVSAFIKEFMQLAKRPNLQLEKTSLEGIVRDIFFSHQSEADQRGIVLSCNWNSDLPWIKADSRLLYQVLSNLLKNAMEAMTEPGTLRIEGRVDGEQFKLEVEDTGPGMTPDVLNHIFDPFFTTKDQKGTGLGLSICKTIMEAHRGGIECRSELGKGTSFILTFPLH
jgi:signal transduction histidine kinase